MDLELIFSIASIIAIIGWLALLAYPLIPSFADKFAGLAIPVVLSAGYLYLIIFQSSGGDGGYDSLASVVRLFSHEKAVLAGWIHFLAFDLLIGAWICRTAQREGVAFWMIVPILLLTFVFGPAGFIAYQLIRCVRQPRTTAAQ